MTEQERKAIERGEERDHRVREAMDLLEIGAEKILDGDEFKRYLAFAARFHRYSANNTLLVLLQRPNSTRVAGYRRWQKLGRQVRRGEEGLKILAPIFHTVEDEESGEKEFVLCSFKVVKVFDVSQTDPVPGAEPIPEKPRPRALRGDSDVARALGRSLLALCGSEGVSVSEDDAELDALSPGANGLYSLREKRILLRSILSTDGTVKTLAHELAHHLLHRGLAASEEDRPALEVEAEGVAYAVLSYFGVDASEYSFAYVARWAESKEVAKAALSNIQKTVGRSSGLWRTALHGRRGHPITTRRRHGLVGDGSYPYNRRRGGARGMNVTEDYEVLEPVTVAMDPAVDGFCSHFGW